MTSFADEIWLNVSETSMVDSHRFNGEYVKCFFLYLYIDFARN